MQRRHDHLLLKIPSRERPEQLLQLLITLSELCDRPAHTEVLITTDEDQRSRYEPIRSKFSTMAFPVTMEYGPRRTKIEAVNRGLPDRSGWDILCVVSDDMVPVLQGYDEQIRKYMRVHFPKGDGCLWFHDGYQDRVCTMPVMDRKYYMRDVNVYDPRFESYYADDIQTELAQSRGRMRKIGICILRHNHRFWNKSVPDDNLYKHNRLAKERDQRLYQLIRKSIR